MTDMKKNYLIRGIQNINIAAWKSHKHFLLDREKELPTKLKSVDQKYYKVFIVFNSDAVIQPFAMMILSEDAFITSAAMVGSWWFKSLFLTFHTYFN